MLTPIFEEVSTSDSLNLHFETSVIAQAPCRCGFPISPCSHQPCLLVAGPPCPSSSPVISGHSVLNLGRTFPNSPAPQCGLTHTRKLLTRFVLHGKITHEMHERTAKPFRIRRSAFSACNSFRMRRSKIAALKVLYNEQIQETRGGGVHSLGLRKSFFFPTDSR